MIPSIRGQTLLLVDIEMTHGILCIPLTFVLASVACAQQPGKDRLEQSVDRGLAFLALMQEKDGSWQGQGFKHPAVTSLAVLAFLSAGHVPGEGPYQATIDRGVRWVLQQQQPNGLFSMPGWEQMYQHGISTLMLTQALPLMDEKTARAAKPKLEKAIKIMLQAQRPSDSPFKGGWRYTVDSTDADISVTGWQVLTLRGARNLGCDVPAERLEAAVHFIRSCRDSQSGGFGYMPGNGPSVACTGTSILALEMRGKGHQHSSESLQAGAYLLKTPLNYDEVHYFYAAFYSAHGMFQLGNNYWAVYRPRLHKQLFAQQKHNGSWLGSDGVSASYSTAMAVLVLTAEYRFLPLFQRDEEADTTRQKSGS